MRAALAFSSLIATFSLNAAAQTPCTGLCQQQVTCANNGTTSVSGTVYSPTNPASGFGQPDPIDGALVYVPNGAAGPPTYGVTPFSPGVHCAGCGTDVSGSPLLSTVTGPDGKFTLTNMPVGNNIPLVIQVGRWRRQIAINVTACANNSLTAAQTRLPRTQAEGDIPRIAISTGAPDAVECLLRKIGIADSEFTNPGGTGRVHLYKGEGGPGAQIDSSTPSATALFGSQSTLNQYDMIFFTCQGARYSESPADQQRVINYVNAGGRLFTTHYSYVWLYNVAPFSGTATWQVDQAAPADQTAHIDTSFPRGTSLAQWLVNVGASATSGAISLQRLAFDFTAVVSPSTRWVYRQTPPAAAVPLQYSFDAPVGAGSGNQCGRVYFMDYHAGPAGSYTGLTFPAECTTAALSPPEKLFEFFVFEGNPCLNRVTQIQNISRGADGHVLLTGQANPGQSVVIHASPDLITPFTDLATVTADVAGNFSYEDAGAASLSKRFYRP